MSETKQKQKSFTEDVKKAVIDPLKEKIRISKQTIAARDSRIKQLDEQNTSKDNLLKDLNKMVVSYRQEKDEVIAKNQELVKMVNTLNKRVKASHTFIGTLMEEE